MSYRNDVVRAVTSEWRAHPAGRPSVYWREVLPPEDLPFDGDYCGALVLRSLQKAGLARGVRWKIGRGFIEPLSLPQVRFPQVGDIAFVPQPFQHQALVIDADPATGRVLTIDGNQPAIEPRERYVQNGNLQFYSIQPLIEQAEREAPAWPWVLAGAGILGACAWVWENGLPKPVERVVRRLAA